MTNQDIYDAFKACSEGSTSTIPCHDCSFDKNPNAKIKRLYICEDLVNRILDILKEAAENEKSS